MHDPNQKALNTTTEDLWDIPVEDDGWDTFARLEERDLIERTLSRYEGGAC